MNIHTLKKMYNQFKFILNSKQKRQSIYVFCVIIIASLFETLGVSAILPLVQAMLTPEKLMEKRYIAIGVTIFNINSVTGLLIMVCIGVIAIYIIKNVIVLISTIIQIKFKLRIQKELSVLMLDTYLKRPYSFYIESNSSELIRGISSDVYGVYGIMESLFKMMAELLVVFFVSLYLIYSDWIMALSILALAILCFLIIHLGFQRPMGKFGEENRIANANINQYAYEIAGGIKEILVMHREKSFLKKYDQSYERKRHTEVWYNFSSAAPERIIEAVCIGGMVGTIGIRIALGMDVNTFIPKLAVVAVAAFRILPSISRITGYVNGFSYYAPTLDASYHNIKDVYEYQNEYNNDYHIEKNEYKIEFRNNIYINDISFSYANTQTPILSNLSLDIKKGESVGIIGSSGAGKTTFADIILGLLVPQKGKILIDDDIDIHSIPIQWSKLIGYVPQNVYLIDDTIRNNIIFGADMDKEADDLVWKALEQAQLKEYVQNLPNGLDTIVGERGVKFSGGQRQRIVIARALYYNPEIIVLDEATSALDNETESAVMEAIDALHNQKTLIIIAHRLSTIMNCDRIIEIKDGKAIERDKKESV